MALLAACWLIIESFLIPEGLLLRRFYLSFYIHPLLLFLCQIFLWIKLVQSWLLLIFCLPIQFTYFVASRIFRFLSRIISFIFSFFRSTNIEFEVNEVKEHETPRIRLTAQYQIAADSYGSSLSTISKKCAVVGVAIREPNVHIDEDINLEEYVEHMSSEYCSSKSSTQDVLDMDTTAFTSSICGSVSHTEDMEMINTTVQSVCSSNSPIMKGELIDQSREADFDSFYQKYTERMRWFDMLNQDRTFGISAILKKQLASPFAFESIKPVEFSIPNIAWSKIARRRLLRSLEGDFELVYVAQSCLSWEALHYQYRKAETLASSGSQNGAFYDNVGGRFQKFQILLERFMEDERCEGKRYWNYVQRRLSYKSLLQVPQVSGYMEDGEDETKGEAMRPIEVLKGIEKCIKAFWLYLKTDKKKPQWKMRSFLWTHPPVEDPRDLQLLTDLTKTLHKELWLKDLQGKKRCWLKRVMNPLEESQKKEILFTMIDMKLVSRVLKISMISTSQLKWCQDKLKNIEFKEGKVVRAYTCSLFPSS